MFEGTIIFAAFIEIDTDGEGNRYLIIRSGSRNPDIQTERLYQERGVRNFYSGKTKNEADKMTSPKGH